MSELNWDKVETILDKALDVPEVERPALIEKECGSNLELKNEVTMLLKSISDSEGWMEHPADLKKDLIDEVAADMKSITKTPSLIGQNVGSYTITEKIGEGGMGTVYLGERSDGEFEHKVAIKIIQYSRASEENIQRFKREQRILANLNHSGIAQLYDGGVTDDGFPYIIMEYIDGMPITEYCSTHNYTIDQKIELFEQVLKAVRNAHENLTIHRDLKPDNILINKFGKVKILDFGISKLLEDEEQDQIITKTDSRILTPRFAAPEQIKQERITTATDLYSLGVVFYNLLTNADPINIDDLTQYQAEQAIINQDPTPPSENVADSFLRKKLRGDLDAITLKAIRKEPDQRYRVANEFLEDLKNYRLELPVSATEGTFSYNASKFIKRNKQPIAYICFAIFLLILSIGYYTYQLAEERDSAQIQSERAEEVTEFLVNILQMNRPVNSLGEDVTVQEALANGLEYLNEREISPLNKATMLGTIGSIQLTLGVYEDAEVSLKQAQDIISEPDFVHNKNTLAIGSALGQLYYNLGKPEEAAKTFLKYDSLFIENDSHNTIDYIVHKLSFSDFLLEQGEFYKSLEILEEIEPTFDSFDKNRELLSYQASLHNKRGIAYRSLAKYDSAINSYETALKIRESLYDSLNPKVALTYHNLAVVYSDVGQIERAIDMEKKVLEVRKKTLGEEHPLTGSSLYLLGFLSDRANNYEEAANYLERSTSVLTEAYGENHNRTLISTKLYADMQLKLNNIDTAEKLLKSVHSRVLDTYGASSMLNGYLAMSFVDLYGELNDQPKQRESFNTAINIFTDLYGGTHPDVGRAKMMYAKFEIEHQNYNSAKTVLNEIISDFGPEEEQENELVKEAKSLLFEIKNNSAS